MSFNRQFFMSSSKAVRSSMPMVIGRVEYEEPIVPAKVKKSSYPDAIYKKGVVTIVKTVMTVQDITHNDKAGIQFISAKYYGPKPPKPPTTTRTQIVEYHYNNPTDITHNNKANVRFIKPKH
jgi:hypothetical protein